MHHRPTRPAIELVRRYGLMAAGAAWTRGVLDQACVLGFLDVLPSHQRTTLADGTDLLGLHASPTSDAGPGIDTTSSNNELARLLAGVEADWVVGGHTHDPTDRRVGTTRVLNPGSVGLPRTLGEASWMVLDASVAGITSTTGRPRSMSAPSSTRSNADVTPTATSSRRS